jgi:hypothetical protein
MKSGVAAFLEFPGGKGTHRSAALRRMVIDTPAGPWEARGLAGASTR